MRSFLFILCAALLLNGVAAASGGRGAAIREAVAGSKVGQAFQRATHAVATKTTDAQRTATAVVTALIIGAVAVCGLQGCDQSRHMVDDVMTPKTTSLEDPFKIGVIYEKGVAHDFTQSLWGAQLAVKQANLAGGIDGREIVLIPNAVYERDEAFAVRVMNNLIDYEKVAAVIGPNFSQLAEYTDEKAARSGVPMVTMGATSGTITRAGESIFLSASPNSFQARVGAKYAVEQLGAETAAILYWGADAYSDDLAQSYRGSFSALGVKVALFESYNYGTAMTNNDFAVDLNDSGLVDRVVNAQADIVAILGFQESGIVAAQLRVANDDAIYFGADGWGATGAETILDWGGKALEGAYYTDLFHPDASPEFTKAYEEEYGFTPDFLSASGYDAAYLVIQAARRTSDNITNETLTQELNNTQDYVGATTILRFDIDRHPIKSLVLYEIKDGQVTLVGTFAP